MDHQSGARQCLSDIYKFYYENKDFPAFEDFLKLIKVKSSVQNPDLAKIVRMFTAINGRKIVNDDKERYEFIIESRQQATKWTKVLALACLHDVSPDDFSNWLSGTPKDKETNQPLDIKSDPDCFYEEAHKAKCGGGTITRAQEIYEKALVVKQSTDSTEDNQVIEQTGQENPSIPQNKYEAAIDVARNEFGYETIEIDSIPGVDASKMKQGVFSLNVAVNEKGKFEVIGLQKQDVEKFVKAHQTRKNTLKNALHQTLKSYQPHFKDCDIYFEADENLFTVIASDEAGKNSISATFHFLHNIPHGAYLLTADAASDLAYLCNKVEGIVAFDAETTTLVFEILPPEDDPQYSFYDLDENMTGNTKLFAIEEGGKFKSKLKTISSPSDADGKKISLAVEKVKLKKRDSSLKTLATITNSQKQELQKLLLQKGIDHDEARLRLFSDNDNINMAISAPKTLLPENEATDVIFLNKGEIEDQTMTISCSKLVRLLKLTGSKDLSLSIENDLVFETVKSLQSKQDIKIRIAKL